MSETPDRRKIDQRVDDHSSIAAEWNEDFKNRRRCVSDRRQTEGTVYDAKIEPLIGSVAAQRDHWMAEAQTAWQQVAELRALLRMAKKETM